MAALAFRLSSGAAAPLAKLAGTCVEIVFVGIRLCDRLDYAWPSYAENVRFCRDSVLRPRPKWAAGPAWRLAGWLPSGLLGSDPMI